jgi:hypothetical protein
MRRSIFFLKNDAYKIKITRYTFVEETDNPDEPGPTKMAL